MPKYFSDKVLKQLALSW